MASLFNYESVEPLIGTGTKAPNPGGAGAKPPSLDTNTALSFQYTAGAFTFSIATQPDGTAPPPHLTSAF